ncbi:MAG: DEAD/DEAH box helicase [Planctomycetaceae bacterium]|nr:DEAD/DEAH box helicase [Planctomycetaceae bacterium]
MARNQNQNQKKSGGQGKNQNRDRNRRQGGTQSPSEKEQASQSPSNELPDDQFDSVLPSYGSFLKDMQYEESWGDDWDDDDTPIERKVAAQKAEKAKAQKKKQQQKKTDNRRGQDVKPPEKLKPPVHDDERLFNSEDDRGLTPEELDIGAERKEQSAERRVQSPGNRSQKAKRSDKQKQVSQKQESQKQMSKGKSAPNPASETHEAEANKVGTKSASAPVASEAVAETVVASAEAISKGGGVSLRVVATKSATPPPNRRKRAAKKAAEIKPQPIAESQTQNAEKRPGKQKSGNKIQTQSAESQMQNAECRMQNAVKRPDKRKPDVKVQTSNADRKSQDAEMSLDANRKAQIAKTEVPREMIDKNLKPRALQGDVANANSQLQTPKSEHQTPKSKRPSKRVSRAVIEPVEIASVPDGGDVEGKDAPSGFGNLKLSKTMLESLKAANYHEPSPVQAGVIPDVLAGRDVMGQARTGTGKTAAFCIPILEGLDECVSGDEPVALILVPTRELAVQVRDEAEKLAKGRKVQIIACYGGKPIGQQIAKLKTGADIVVGTPGRILDLSRRGALKLDSLIWVVLDEADRMLDIGFRPDIEKILRLTPSDRQTLLFSATLPPDVVKLAERYMRDPKVIDFSEKQMAVETIDQYYITIDRDRKLQGLICLINEQQPKQAIVFCRTKRGADRVKRQLEDKFESLDSLHGDMVQATRDRVMSQFRAGKLQILVATDVVGRGIDVTGISHIINYDIPVFCDDYVHRVGRTGRMGREGTAYTFVTAEEGQELTRIEMRINQQLKRAELKNFEAVSQIVPGDKEPPQPVFGKSSRRVRRAL